MPDEQLNRENFDEWLISQGITESVRRNISAALGNTAEQLTPETKNNIIDTNLFSYSDADEFNAARELIEHDTCFSTANQKSGKRFERGLNFYAAFLSGGTIPPTGKSVKKTSAESKKTTEEATPDEKCTIKTPKEELISYMKGFYGFGNTKSDLYLIGQEEGGGETDHRCKVWKENGCPEVIDIQVMHRDMPGAEHYFNNNASTVEPQSTYAPLITNIVVPFFNYEEQTDYEFQACHFGRENRHYPMFVSDLYPLPCKNLNNNDWERTYERVLGITKPRYRTDYQNERAQHLKDLVAKNKPKVVIMYGGIGKTGKDFDPFWNEIAGNPEWNPKYYSYTQQAGNNAGKEINIPFYMYENNKTLFIKMGHPLYKPIGYLTLIFETISSYVSHCSSK